jgi:hypothetical protein
VACSCPAAFSMKRSSVWMSSSSDEDFSTSVASSTSRMPWALDSQYPSFSNGAFPGHQSATHAANTWLSLLAMLRRASPREHPVINNSS